MNEKINKFDPGKYGFEVYDQSQYRGTDGDYITITPKGHISLSISEDSYWTVHDVLYLEDDNVSVAANDKGEIVLYNGNQKLRMSSQSNKKRGGRRTISIMLLRYRFYKIFGEDVKRIPLKVSVFGEGNAILFTPMKNCIERRK